MKELNRGVKAPYHGFLLNMTEFQQYNKMQEIFPELVEFFEEQRKTRKIKQD